MNYTELERLKALREYQILDTQSEKIFDDITRLLAQLCQSKIALISFVDENRQWFKSKIGLDICETARDIAFCNQAIKQDDIFIIEDTLKDDRFRNNPLVTGEPHLRFYAGIVLQTQEGFNIGTLCVADTEPKQLNELQIETFKNLGSLVMTQIELRKKKAELEEEKAKARHNIEVLNALPDFAGTCDLNGIILSYNNSFGEMCRKEGVDHIFDYYPHWAKRIQEQVAIPYAIEHGIWRGESAVLKKTGEEFHIFQTVICHRDAYGYPKFFSTVMQDMSQIRTATNRFETLTKMAPVGIFMTDPKGTPNFFNEHWFKMTGMTFEKAMADNGFGSFASVHEDDLENLIEKWFTATQSKSSFSLEFRIRNQKTGKIHYVQSKATPMLDPNNEVTGYLGANQDMTEEKELSQRLSSSVKQLETFIRNIPTAVAMFDKEIRYVAVSKRWIQDYRLDKLGFDEHNIIGKSHYDVFTDLSQEWKTFHKNALNGIAHRKTDDQFQREDGSIETLNWDVRPWFNEKNDIGGILMLTEVTTSRK